MGARTTYDAFNQQYGADARFPTTANAAATASEHEYARWFNAATDEHGHGGSHGYGHGGSHGYGYGGSVRGPAKATTDESVRSANDAARHATTADGGNANAT